MKQGRVFFSCLLILCTRSFLSALELKAVAGLGNLAFDSESEYSLAAAGESFEAHAVPFGLISVEGEYSDTISFGARVERDPLLLTRALGVIGFNYNYVNLEIGPVIGLFNTEDQPVNPGIAAGIFLQYPGIIFGSLDISSTIGVQPDRPGDYLQSTGEASIGFWVPNVICSFSAGAKKFTRRINNELLTIGEHIRSQLSFDVYSKNVPYTIRIDLGYQSLKRSYVTEDIAGRFTETDELKSIYGGFEGTWRIAAPLKLILGLEMPLYTWAEQPLQKPGSDTVFFQIHAGAVWSFNQ
jgi:hypothetical protein